MKLILLTFIFLVSITVEAKNCQKPLTFSIGKIDEKFGITKQTAVILAKKAAHIWNRAGAGQVLKLTSEKADYTVHFIYDARQAKVNKLKSAHQGIEKIKENSMTLKEHEAQILALQNSIKSQSEAYTTKVQDFEEEVNRRNKNQDWDKAAIARTEEQKQQLQAESKAINEKVEKLNRLISAHNDAIKYNKAKGAQLVEEFNQNSGGKFVSGLCNRGTKEIIIYEFESLTRLVFLLAHELGHALGIDHVENKESIMFPENAFNNYNTKLTQDDIRALKKVCAD